MVSVVVDCMCILCGARHSLLNVELTVKGDSDGCLSVVRCAVCGHFQLNPPTFSIEHYNQDGQVSFVVHDYGTPLEKLVEHSWIEAGRRVRRFEERGISLAGLAGSRPLRVLDIGGGYGFFAAELMGQFPGARVGVMEPSPMRAARGLEYLAARGGSHPVPEFLVEPLNENFVARQRGTYDLVTLWHVLEHVTNPVEFLAWATGLVRPDGGIVCVEVPNVDDELMRLSSAFRARNFMIEHISYFSHHTLESVARRAAPEAEVTVQGYQRYGIFNYFHWIHFNKPQGANPDLFEGEDRWWLERTWRSAREEAMTSDALFMIIRV